MMIEKLPDIWIGVELAKLVTNPKDNIVDGPFGSNLKATEYVENGIPILRLQNIDRNNFLNKNIRYITDAKYDELKRHNIKSGDIAITKLGAPLGKATIIPHYINKAIIVADIIRMRIENEFIDSKYVTFAINSPRVAEQFSILTKGTTRPRVNLKQIRNIKIPIAPLNEQRRIVDKIEQLFSNIDKGVALLKKVQQQLNIYRQSVLKAAVTGELTKDWRVANKHRLEPGDVLLKRILKTRLEQWNGRGQYKEPATPDNSNLPELPDGWVWQHCLNLVSLGVANQNIDRAMIQNYMKMVSILSYKQVLYVIAGAG